MKPLFTQKEFNNSKSTTKLPCKCYICDNIFYKEKKLINQHLKNKNNNRYSIKFCSMICRNESKITKVSVNCKNCNIEFDKRKFEFEKSLNHFCSHSCHATYTNTHKTTGTRRSKLEIWLEEQLIILYPNLEIHFNKKNTINSELDIYIPSLNLAFELNGIFHYEPIYGVNKLNQIQKNDISKSKACHDAKIDLCIIDVSKLKYFKPSNAQQYLNIIINIISKNV